MDENLSTSPQPFADEPPSNGNSDSTFSPSPAEESPAEESPAEKFPAEESPGADTPGGDSPEENPLTKDSLAGSSSVGAPYDSSSGETPFMAAPFRGKNTFWRYFWGAVLPFVAANFLGAIPLVVLMVIRNFEGMGSEGGGGGQPDFEAMGIGLNGGFVLMVFPFVLAFLTMLLIVKPLHHRRFATVINGGGRFRWRRALVAAGVWIAISAVIFIISLKSDPANFRLNNLSGSLLVLIALSLLLIPIQAAYEEILFRGYLMQGFAVLTRNRWLPVLITSILFGLMHSINPEVQEFGFALMMPQYIFFGLVFAVATMLDDGIEIAIGAHAANNIFVSVTVTHSSTALQTPAIFEQLELYPQEDFVTLAVMSALFLASMFFIYRWKDLRRLYARIVVPSDTVDAG